jgi:hypothetical protein
MAANDVAYPGPTEDFPDWIELHNPTGTDIPLDGYTISDDPKNPGKHVFEGLTLTAGGYLVLLADDQEDDGPEHVSFKLSASGESITLSRPDGTTIDSLLWETEIPVDFSVARIPDCSSTFEYDQTSTPGATNAL